MDSSLKTPFTIKKITAFSSWVHNLKKNTECTICRCHLNVPSLYNQEKGIDSIVVSGICNHSFHEECINPWIKTNNYCPICFQKWEFVKQDKIIETVCQINKSKFLDSDIKKYIYKKYEHELIKEKNITDEDLNKNIDNLNNYIINKINKDIIIEKKNDIIITAELMANTLIKNDKEKIIKIFKNNKDKDLK